MANFGYPVDQERLSSQFGSRNGPINRFIWHHQASTNDNATIAMMVNETRQVSATYTVNNDNYKGRGWSRITGVVPERYRPWTSASYADGSALTAEVCNSSGDPTWGIADATHEACARLAAYAYTEYGVPLRRGTKSDQTGHIRHDEVLKFFGTGYATACPMHLDIDRIIARAKQLVSPTPPTTPTTPAVDVQEEEMLLIFKSNGAAYLLVGSDLAYAVKSGADANALKNVNEGVVQGVPATDPLSDELWSRLLSGRTKK